MTPALRRLLSTSAALSASFVVVATTLAGPATADPSPGSDGIGDDYFPLDGNGGIDVQHYAIDDAYDFDTGELTGTTTIDLTATQDLSRFNLDLLLPVTGVTVDGDDAGYEDQSGDDGHELVITPDEPIADGDTVTVVVDFAGDPDDYPYDPPSLSFPDGTGWLANGHEYVTMNEPHMAPWWFASNDHPLDKATYDISITADDDDQVISNGDLVSQGSAGAGLTTTTWRMDDPMASYLAFVAVGDFAVRTGTTAGLPWTYAVSRAASDTAGKDAQELGERSARVTAWLQDQVGTYPFSSTGGVTTALQSGFALENQTRPTYPDEPSRALMAHELGHQWFGDSVAVHGWKDIWLNEGFASYLANLYREDHGGATTNQRLERSYQNLKGNDGFWQLDIADPGPNRIFGGEVYTRGAMALEALRNKVGHRDMRKVLRTWAADKEGGNGTVEEFTDLAADVSGQDLTTFFQVWLSTPKAPKHTKANGFLKK